MNMKIRCKNNNNNGRPRLVFFDLQESSITEAVAKQLNATTMTQSLTPQMGKKGIPASGGGSSSGGGLTPSGGLLEQPVGTPMSETGSTSTKLSTFSSQGKGNVQMRRTTNKQGKQAPAPPKRTSLLSTSRDSTYREDDSRNLIDEHNTNGLTRDINSLTQRYDSENDNTTGDPDTDATGDSLECQNIPTSQSKVQHSLHSGGIGPRSAQQHSSFKRPTPVMGNRGLETRQSKRSQHQQQHHAPRDNSAGGCTSHHVTVGALEVNNVKCVVNRYGTLPKVQRIGAYLNSLEDPHTLPQHSIATHLSTVAPVATTNGHGGHTAAIRQQLPAGHVMPLPPPMKSVANVTPGGICGNIPAPPQQMIRSNSSSGVTMQNSASASLNKLQRHRTAADGTMMTFSSFRGTSSSNSPKRSQQPALANLEFPPPPLDLPPPPEEFETPPPPPPPAPAAEVLEELQQSASITSTQYPLPNSSSNDVSNTAPSVEEASTRFGVSLRKREPSTDSCSSLGSPPEVTNANTNAGGNVQEFNMKEKLMAEIKDRSKENSANNANLQNGSTIPAGSGVDPVSLLFTELAEMNLTKQKTTPPQPPKAQGGGSNGDSGGSQTQSQENGNTNSFKAQLKKVEPKKLPTPTQKTENQTTIIDFKAHLRKVEKDPKDKKDAAIDEAPKNILQKAQTVISTGTLGRKGDKKFTTPMTMAPTMGTLTTQQKTENAKHDMTNSNSNNGNTINPANTNTNSTTNTNGNTQHNANANSNLNCNNAPNTTEPADAPVITNDGDAGKRRSTGSIHSLKKLWEQPGSGADYASTQSQANCSTNSGSTGTNSNITNSTSTSSTNQLSPKFSLKPISNAATTPTTNSNRFPPLSTQISPRTNAMNATNSMANKPPPAAPPPPPPTTNNSTNNQTQNHNQNSIFNNSHYTKSQLTTSLSTQLFTDGNHQYGEQSTSNTNNSTANTSTGNNTTTNNEIAAMSQSLFVEHSSAANTGGNLMQPNNKLTTSTITTNAAATAANNTTNNKPAVPLKPTKLTIYATPISQKIAASALDSTTNTPLGSALQSSTQISRESILELVGLLETSLHQHPVNSISASQWLQLSDKLNILQNNCVVFADNETMPPHSKFHFRELVTRVETQSQSLRTAGSKNVQDNERLVSEVGQSLKQLTNALHR
uniref:Tyrosine-protein kinase Abl n=1 Tax=Bactrocera latifrons TaxID=174628 RepID=A0A0K8WCD5_BACLA